MPHFDLSPSDLKHISRPPWISEVKSKPTLMLYSVVDDRSGVSYQEYRCVYGEDVEAALRFLFNAMSQKSADDFIFQGIPQMIYMDNGPISKSHLFLQVMDYLGIKIRTHLPAGKDGRRVTARSKGKVERPFRTVKEMHETLYHFHKPETEDQANQWLIHFLKRYNSNQHRSEKHSRFEDWLKNQPESGIQAMCNWEKYCSFAREPEERLVNVDSTVTVEGVKYRVSPELAGEKVVLWWGMFDQELFVELDGEKYGPYFTDEGPIPLHKYRSHKKTSFELRAERVDRLAKSLELPKTALDGGIRLDIAPSPLEIKDFNRPDPFKPEEFSSLIKAKKAISTHLNMPLAKLTDEQKSQVDFILTQTLRKDEVFKKIDQLFSKEGEEYAN
jgi:hypothetical protein